MPRWLNPVPVHAIEDVSIRIRVLKPEAPTIDVIDVAVAVVVHTIIIVAFERPRASSPISPALCQVKSRCSWEIDVRPTCSR